MERRTELSRARKIPRSAKFYIWLILTALLLTFIVVTVSEIVGNLRHAEMSEEQALAQLDSYREGDMVNLDAFLHDQGFEATGAAGAYVYQRDDKIVAIQDYDNYVRVGNGQGTSHEYGTVSIGGSYVCRVRWPEVDSGTSNYCDIVISAEALAEVVRWVYR